MIVISPTKPFKSQFWRQKYLLEWVSVSLKQWPSRTFSLTILVLPQPENVLQENSLLLVQRKRSPLSVVAPYLHFCSNTILLAYVQFRTPMILLLQYCFLVSIPMFYVFHCWLSRTENLLVFILITFYSVNICLSVNYCTSYSLLCSTSQMLASPPRFIFVNKNDCCSLHPFLLLLSLLQTIFLLSFLMHASLQNPVKVM